MVDDARQTMPPPRTQPASVWSSVAATLAIPAFLVVTGVFVAARLLDIYPWTALAWDAWAYWLTRDGPNYTISQQGNVGAYLYSPAFAQAIAPLVALPWPLFTAIWTAFELPLIVWLSGRLALVVVLLPPVALSVLLGQLDLAFAVVALVGLRWPAVWALPLLTKVTPGVGLVWFLARGEWRSLGIALAATAVIGGISYVADPEAWRAWVAFLARMDFPALGNGLIFVPISIWVRLPLAALLVAWGARSDRRWVLPVGVWLAMPTIWVNSPAILVGLLPLARIGASTPAAAWLRGQRESDGLVVGVGLRPGDSIPLEAPEASRSQWRRSFTLLPGSRSRGRAPGRRRTLPAAAARPHVGRIESDREPLADLGVLASVIPDATEDTSPWDGHRGIPAPARVHRRDDQVLRCADDGEEVRHHVDRAEQVGQEADEP